MKSMTWRLLTVPCLRRSFIGVRFASTVTLRGKLPSQPARTRFAPSPTGTAHLGSLRTALFNYLLARKTKGQFLLRLEDTDRKRTVPGAEEKLYEDLQWAGLQWDEGPVIGGPYGPYRQSERTPIYQAHVNALLYGGHAYRCFCPAERLDDLNRRRHEKGLPLGYDRKCAHLSAQESAEKAHKGEAHVVRFRSPQEWPRYHDLVFGKTGHGAEKTKKLLIDEPVWEDSILIKSDGFPTYHWANICDDHDMKISHVVRGAEWMSSTPLHVALYQAMGWESPVYAHVPLLVDKNGQKLSKRYGNSDVSSFKELGIFSESLTNFAALLGWSHQRKDDVMNLAELEQTFDMKITKGNTIVSFDKLWHLQEQHARRCINAGGEPFEQMIRDVAVAVLDKYGAGQVAALVGKRPLRDVIASMLQAKSLRYRSAQDFAEQVEIFVGQSRPPPLQPEAFSSTKDLQTAASSLCLTPAEYWTRDVHSTNILNLRIHESEPGRPSDNEKRWKKELYHYLRWALLGGVAGPSIPETMEILGRAVCVRRIQRAAAEANDLEVQNTRPNTTEVLMSAG
jgi:glutamyl-tRNA synthetase